MTTLANDPSFSDLDALLDAAMDDVADLPPMGVPPTGHYNLLVTGDRKPVAEMDAIVLTYEIVAINEVTDDSETSSVKVGQKFTENFMPKKKDGEVNDIAIGAMKARFAPFAMHFGIEPSQKGGLAAVLQKLREGVPFAAVVKRVPNKKDPEFPRMKIEDIVVL